jgi:hypothetical protein
MPVRRGRALVFCHTNKPSTDGVLSRHLTKNFDFVLCLGFLLTNRKYSPSSDVFFGRRGLVFDDIILRLIYH